MREDKFETLNRPFAPCEVKNSLMSIEAYKAPGPGRFPTLVLPHIMENCYSKPHLFGARSFEWRVFPERIE